VAVVGADTLRCWTGSLLTSSDDVRHSSWCRTYFWSDMYSWFTVYAFEMMYTCTLLDHMSLMYILDHVCIFRTLMYQLLIWCDVWYYQCISVLYYLCWCIFSFSLYSLDGMFYFSVDTVLLLLRSW